MNDPTYYQHNIIWDVTWQPHGPLLLTEFGIDRQLADGSIRSMDGDPDYPLDIVNDADVHLLADAVLALLPPDAPVSHVGWERVPYLLVFGRDELSATNHATDRDTLRDALTGLDTPNSAYEWFFIGGDSTAHTPDALLASAKRLDSIKDRTPVDVLTQLTETYTAVLYGAWNSVIWATRVMPGLQAQQHAALAAVATRYGLVLPSGGGLEGETSRHGDKEMGC